MQQGIALLFTFIIGLFILLGTLIVFKVKNSDKLIAFSISMAFGVMIALAIGELIPESYELLESTCHKSTLFTLIVLCLLGIAILKLLDYFIPNHEHHHKEKETHKQKRAHLYHIGIVSSVALILHNLIEGMAIYSSTVSDISLGLLVSLGVGLHNIPMGMVIASTLYDHNKSKKKTFIIGGVISIATLFGGILMYLFQGNLVNDFTLGILLAITLGMILYIALFELLEQVIHTKYRKTSTIGIGIGILVLLISLILE